MGWTVDIHELPGDGTDKVIASIPYKHVKVTDRLNSFGDGSVSVPAEYGRLAEILDPDNDVGSLVWLKRDGVATDLAFYARKSSEDVAADAARLVNFTGPGIGQAVMQTVVQPYTTGEQLDWIWGGKNILSNPDFEDSGAIAAQYDLWNDGTGGTFTLTVDGQTTSSLDYNDSPNDIETALELLSTVVNCLVEGTGDEADPWRISFVDPAYPVANMTITDSVTGGESTLDVVTQGADDPSPWTKVTQVQRGAPPVIASYASNGWYADDTVPLNGTWAWRINGLLRYAGIQQVVRVTPGMTYQLKAPIRTSTLADTFRLVLRTTMEEYLGGSTWPSDTVDTINVWDETTFVASDIVIPDDVTEAIFRHAYVGTGNPLPYLIDGCEMNEGLAPTSAGDILDLLLTAAQARGALSWLTWTFTDTDDTNGDPWDETALSFRANRGQNLGQVLGGLSKFGIEYRVFWNGTSWELGLYNAHDEATHIGGAGTDRSGDDSPALLLGRGITSGPVQKNAPVATVVYAEGKDGLWAEAEDAAMITAWGRLEVYVVDTNIEDLPTLQILADATLGQRLGVAGSKLVVTRQSPEPYDAMFLGDTVQTALPPAVSRAPRRIVGIVTQLTDDGEASWETDLDRATFGEATSVTEGVRRLLTKFQKQFVEPAGSGIPIGLGGAGPIEVTWLVASEETRDALQGVSDFVCTGDDDDVQIKLALAECDAAGGGRVMLTEGTFYIGSSGDIDIPANTTLAGIGFGTVIDCGNNDVVFDVGTSATIRDLKILGEAQT